MTCALVFAPYLVVQEEEDAEAKRCHASLGLALKATACLKLSSRGSCLQNIINAINKADAALAHQDCIGDKQAHAKAAKVKLSKLDVDRKMIGIEYRDEEEQVPFSMKKRRQRSGSSMRLRPLFLLSEEVYLKKEI